MTSTNPMISVKGPTALDPPFTLFARLYSLLVLTLFSLPRSCRFYRFITMGGSFRDCYLQLLLSYSVLDGGESALAGEPCLDI